MKGLIYKDILCLKKNLKMFSLVTFGIVSLAVMYVISSKHGNVADFMSKTDFGEDTMTKTLLLSMLNMALLIVINIPMAFIGNILDCFNEDKKAGFHNILFALPISKRKIVAARYASLLLYLLLGFVCTGVSAVTISIVSDEYTFFEIMGTVFSFAGANLVYMSIVMPLLYFFGQAKGEIILIAPIGIALIGVGAYLINKFENIPDELFDMESLKFMNSFIDFITSKGIFVFLAGAGCLLCSYLISVVAFNRKGDLRS